MSQVESKVEEAQPPHPAPAKRPLGRTIARGLTCGAIIALFAFVLTQIRTLWNEWQFLQSDLGAAQQNQVVGYRDIAPMAAYAARPGDWFRTKGDESMLWSRWEDGVGHRWFRFSQGDIDRARLGRPRTQFISRPIDYPIIEKGGGEIWQRIPPDATVVCYTLHGLKCVYPVMVLGKVQVINDIVEDHPYLIAANLLAAGHDGYSIYDADFKGHRLTMAASGYFQGGKPLLYDRGSESLWIDQGESLKAITGKHKGDELSCLAHPAPVTWKSWVRRNQDSRLCVGADRSRGIPVE